MTTTATAPYALLNTTTFATNLSNLSLHTRLFCMPDLSMINQVTIAVFTMIFVLSVVGNSLVIVTIVQNRRMRTPTNMFLLSLAISDLLLSVICMPPTLTAFVFRCFFFGPYLCGILKYMQPLSVSASAHTLVVIAVERYYAICKPLHSRKWQTRRHCLKMIGAVWIVSAVINLPYVISARVQPLRQGLEAFNCKNMWPHPDFKRYYWLVLGLTLFIIPSIIMTALYIAVVSTLYKGMEVDTAATQIKKYSTEEELNSNGASNTAKASKKKSSSGTVQRRVNLRSTHSHRNLIAKKKVIRMLAVIVVEFNCCWVPLFLYHTLVHFKIIPPDMICISVFLSLAYMSSCTNPLTYCFMNKKFRNAFLIAFGCHSKSSLTNNASLYQSAAPLQHQITQNNRAVTMARKFANEQRPDEEIQLTEGAVRYRLDLPAIDEC